jgi:hypothetical protein
LGAGAGLPGASGTIVAAPASGRATSTATTRVSWSARSGVSSVRNCTLGSFSNS